MIDCQTVKYRPVTQFAHEYSLAPTRQTGRTCSQTVKRPDSHREVFDRVVKPGCCHDYQPCISIYTQLLQCHLLL